MANKFLNLLATASLAIVACSFGAQPANALSTNHHDIGARHHVRAQDITPARKARRSLRRRQDTTLCRVREPTSSSVAASTTETPIATPAVEDIAKAVPSVVVPAADVAVPTNSNSNSNSGSGSGSGSSSGGSNSGSSGGGNHYTGGSGGNPCGQKAGLAWNMGDRDALSTWSAGGGRCLYNWSSWPMEKASSAGFVVAPMLWGGDKVAEFEANMPKYTSPTLVLHVNEPNESGQSNMSPEYAVQLWRDHMEPQKQRGHTLCSPAVSSALNGFTWMESFMSQCTDCSIDCVATHWYGTNADEFIAYQQKFLDRFGLPLVVTEFACHDFSGGPECDYNQARSFLRKTTAWLEGESRVWAYMAFGALDDMVGVSAADQLLDTSNYQPNALGWSYLQVGY